MSVVDITMENQSEDLGINSEHEASVYHDASNTQSQANPNKRVIVDAYNDPVVMPDKKRGKMELDKDQRDNVLRFILAVHIRISSIIAQADAKATLSNLHISQQLTSIFTTVHNCLRQKV